MIHAGGPDSEFGRAVGGLVVFGAFFLVICGGPVAATGVWIAHRRLQMLRLPWVCWPVEYVRTGNSEHMRLLDQDGQVVQTHLLNSWTALRRHYFDETTTQVWFAGDPLRRGVFSRPGGADLSYCWAVAPPTSPRAATSQGDLGAPAAPHPPMLRRTLAYVLDVVLHLAAALTLTILTHHSSWNNADSSQLDIHVGAVLLFFLLISFLDRVVLQGVVHTTVGKAPFGLVIIDRDTGRPPRMRWLLACWLVGGLMPLLVVGNSPVPEKPARYLLPAVRRKDM
ncbi:RDD family protein [Nocardia sp. JW2]|uniref:RDD family protein n=1 Tax=Nocardia sp. JW2 TaxID=3450738 RepID=UPI003F42CDC6